MKAKGTVSIFCLWNGYGVGFMDMEVVCKYVGCISLFLIAEGV